MRKWNSFSHDMVSSKVKQQHKSTEPRWNGTEKSAQVSFVSQLKLLPRARGPQVIWTFSTLMLRVPVFASSKSARTTSQTSYLSLRENGIIPVPKVWRLPRTKVLQKISKHVFKKRFKEDVYLCVRRRIRRRYLSVKENHTVKNYYINIYIVYVFFK